MGQVYQLPTKWTLAVKSKTKSLLGLKDGMGVGTDTMMPPKFGFVKSEGEFKPTSE